MVKKDSNKKSNNNGWQLKIVIRSSPDGPIIAEKVVKDADLSNHYTEMWREGYLRKGYMNISIHDMTYSLEPVFDSSRNSNDDQVCEGFIIETMNPGNKLTKKKYSIYSLDLAALRIIKNLLVTKNKKQKNQVYYNVIAHHQSTLIKEADDGSANSVKCLKVKKRESKPLRYIQLPLDSILDKATGNNINGNTYPVFYTNEAFEKAEKMARKGACLNPAVETGALLIGVLGSCPKSKEFYVIIKDVLELCEADQSMYSLTPSSRTWKQIQDHIKSLQHQSETSLFNILGQCHGHNFVPEKPEDSGKPNSIVSSAFLSAEDRVWSEAVFNQEPCQLCHIFGYDQNENKVDSLFGLKDGRLLQRGYYLLPEFNLKSHC
ncbi:hypothetical protein AYK24_07290 [Thermoplasmatales archaeon SG8-52-4]|nr:MAG: hypothetical protein AYK24_07290 [Thermoplasmatales archaeon SG8-52-4]